MRLFRSKTLAEPWALATRIALSAALALGALTLAPTPAVATTLLDQSVAQMSAHAERIVIGRVKGVRSWMDRTQGIRIFTEATIEVVETLKGERAPALVRLEQLGGTAGEGSERRTQTIAGSPKWKEGEVVLLFLEHTDTGRLVTSALSMGKYSLEPGVGGRVMARRDISELNRLGVKRAPERMFLGAPPSEDLLALADLRRLIAGKKLLVFPRVLGPISDAAVAPQEAGPRTGPAAQGEVLR